MLERRLPGPGTRIVSQQLEFLGYLRVGDQVKATVTVLEKLETPRRVVFDCVVETGGQRVLWGTTVVEAPERKAHFPEIERPEFIIRRNDVFVRLLQRCESLPPVSCAVAHPCDPDSLLGALEAARVGLIVPVLVGPAARIRALAEHAGRGHLQTSASSTPSTAMPRLPPPWRSRATARSRR